MDEQTNSSGKIVTGKNIISLLILTVLIVAIPVGVGLIKTQLTLKSKAGGHNIQFTGQGVTCNGNNCVTTQVDATGHATVDLEITSPRWSTLSSFGNSSVPSQVPTIVNSPTPPSPSLAVAFNIKVLEIKYFPVDATGLKLDGVVSGTTDDLTAIRLRTSDLTQQALSKITEATRYHGYKNPSVPSAVQLTLLDSKEFLTPLPVSTNKVPWDNAYRPDYRKILNDLNICDYVDNKNVRQVWLWGYHTDKVEPVESDMSMGSISKNYWNHGTYGDLSNSEQIDDLPLCQHTYVLYNYNFGRGLGEMLEDHDHHIESVLGYIDNNLWNQNFINPHGLTGGQLNHCGWTHSPPNVSDANQYDWTSETTVKSDCEDWKPDGGGQIKNVNCHTWYGSGACLSNSGVDYKVWWMQNIPGVNNGLTFQGKILKDWWEFYADFDAAITKGRTLTL